MLVQLGVKQITSGLGVTTGGNLWMLRWRGFWCGGVQVKNLRQRKDKTGLPESTDPECFRFPLHKNVIFKRNFETVLPLESKWGF